MLPEDDDIHFQALRNAQTQPQRQQVLAQLHAVDPARYAAAPARVQRLYEGYVAGELCWDDVCALRDAPLHLP
ncbi:hypothetical protein KBK19_19710 [Microvirga sp. STR05]|uniref:Antitoxin VbhA domain-containing protein n=1 Tax=Hymenobacter duratus TaxID=2771356 RepID=A0ABR8JK81_9BACT|nr:hypothetical protein [Hymenobacter duratus]MBD2717276.1 hypothetical protein [Hymenobacter duratus]MBR7952196.1 hypothetical protein [Microvirga sp. STR05]